MTKRAIIHILNCAIFTAIVLPAYLMFGPKASPQTNPASLIGTDRYAQREAVRYEKFCRADPKCLEDITVARRAFMDLEVRARPPGKRWHRYHGFIGPDPAAVARSNEILAVTSYARRSSIHQVLDDYVIDYRNALALAENGLWHLGYEHEQPCWLIGTSYPEGYYNCFDYGRKFYVFPDVNLLK